MYSLFTCTTCFVQFNTFVLLTLLPLTLPYVTVKRRLDKKKNRVVLRTD